MTVIEPFIASCTTDVGVCSLLLPAFPLFSDLILPAPVLVTDAQRCCTFSMCGRSHPPEKTGAVLRSFMIPADWHVSPSPSCECVFLLMRAGIILAWIQGRQVSLITLSLSLSPARVTHFPSTIFLGYGDGTIEIFDMRNKKVYAARSFFVCCIYFIWNLHTFMPFLSCIYICDQ
jgi:hypothetical protein